MNCKKLKKMLCLLFCLAVMSILLPGAVMAATPSNASSAGIKAAGVTTAVPKLKLTGAKTTPAVSKLIGFAFLQEPAQSEYLEGQSFERSADILLDAQHESDVDDEVIDSTDPRITITPSGALTTADTKLTFSYTENGVTLSVDWPITVSPKGTLKNIEASTTQDLTFTAGDGQIDVGLLTVIANYSNGTSIKIDTGKCTVTPEKDFKLTDTSITISYTEDGVTATTTLPITVTKDSTAVVPRSMEITKAPYTVYNVGDSFDRGGLEVKVTFTDGSTKVIGEDDYFFTITPDKDLKLTDTSVKVSYFENEVTVSADLPITVTEAVIPKSMEITKKPKAEYYVGDSFDRGGLEVKVTYSDGSTKVICEDDYFFTITPDKELKLTDTSVTISYTENEVTVSAELPVTVTEAVVPKSMVITKKPKTEYYAGDSIDRGGLEVKVTYSDGSTKVISEEDYFFTITPEKGLKTSDTSVTVSYFENEVTVSAKLPITVRSRSGSSGGGGSDSDSGSSSSYTGSAWSQSAGGWQYKENGTPVKDAWRFLSYNGVSYWYYFDGNGMMKTGWIDLNGSRYYLYPVSDGHMGRMLIGWNLIEGVWYYFETEAGKDQGHMYSSERTPDGYYVGPDGAWDGRPAV